jgi:lipoate---protein ligase
VLIVPSSSRDVYRNLAAEEWLLDHAPQLPILFLCVNSPCVVIGKNQNPWRECRLSLMEAAGVPLARRISGGGTVYHDEGNLNVGVIVPRTQYQEGKQYELVLRTLAGLGITASKHRQNSLAVEGKKFSGNAFCFRRQNVLHHLTLLVNADLARLSRYLGPELEGIETKAVASIPDRVMNLADAAAGLTVETLLSALAETFKEMYEGDRAVESGGGACVPEKEILQVAEKISSDLWTYCHTPRFSVTLNGQPLTVEKGRIVNLENQPLFNEWRKKDAADI